VARVRAGLLLELALEPLHHLGGDMSKHHARIIPPERQKTHLEKKHAELAERIEALDGRLSLTPSEELELQQLKKQKLWAKDALEDVG
jgi:uncharacterized protein YdcH (DUF465 family)